MDVDLTVFVEFVSNFNVLISPSDVKSNEQPDKQSIREVNSLIAK